MAAKKKEIPAITVEELGLAGEALAPAVEVVSLDVPPQRQAGKILQGEPAETARELVRLLHEEAKVI
jgi:electron transfer flavoprotein beta subunit